VARRHPIGIGLMAIAIFLIPSGAASAGSGSSDALADAASPTIVDTDVVTDTVSETTGDVTDTVSETTGETTDTVSETTSDVTDTVSQTKDDVTDTVSETTGETTDTVSETTSDVTDTVSETKDEVTDTVSETTGETTDTVSDNTSDVTDTVSESTAGVAGTVSDGADRASGAGRTAGEATNTTSDTQGSSGWRSGSAANADTTRVASNVRPVRLSSAPARVVSVVPADRPFYASTSMAAAVSTGGQSFSLNLGACNLHRTGEAVQCSDASQDEGVLGLFLGVTGVALFLLFALWVAFASSGAASLVIARRLSGASRPA
jgi:gas vesicle protein